MPNEALEILLAEDDEGQAFLVQRNLERAGIANCITRVVDGQQALDFIFREGRFAARVSGLRELEVFAGGTSAVEVAAAVR